MRNSLIALFSIAVSMFATAAWAVDGVVEINQARALAGGVTASDTAGFPVTLDASGSYRLTSNLDTSAAGLEVSAIEIIADDVSVDLNGFRIAGPAVCSGSAGSISCSSGAGVGVLSIAMGSWVHNGRVVGFAGGGVLLADEGRGEKLRTADNGGNGFASGDRSVALQVISVGNGNFGIVVGEDSLVTSCATTFNNASGMSLGAGSGFSNNVVSQNGNIGVAGGLYFDQNVCDGTLVCDACSPSPELCNGLDDDCDGTVDDGNPEGGSACSTGLGGACEQGTMTCTTGSLVCQPDVAPSPEVCDGLDNDCDGIVDDGNPGGGGGCSTGLAGVCAVGTTTCSGGALACQQDVAPSAEVCDGLDNDCDGIADDGNPGGGAGCSTGLLGVCDAGTTTCSGGSLACQQDVFPSGEVCDGLDNDCDGSVDEGGVCG